jgi:hypothetical protein
MDPLPSPDPAAGKADRALAWLLGSLALLLILGLQLLEPLYFLRDDNATHFLPAYLHAFESLADRLELPLLNQHQDLGGTFLATGQTGVFLAVLYPVMGILRLAGADPSLLIEVLATLHLVLAALGMWALLRQLAIRPAIAFPLALCWCCLPFALVAGRAWVFVTYLVAYLPCNLLLLLRFLARPSARLLAAWTAVKVFFLLSGYVHYMVLASLYEGVFLLLRWRTTAPGKRGGEVTSVALVFGLTALAGAPLLLPMLEARAASSYRSHPLPVADALAESMGPLDFLAAQVFRPELGKIFLTGSTSIFFLGLPLLFFLVLALRRWRGLGPTFGAALGSGLFALAMSTGLFWLLHQLPLFDNLRFPFKSFPLAAFFLFPAIAQAAQDWAAASPRRLRAASLLLWANLALQAICLLPPAWRSPFVPYRLDRSVEALRSAPLLKAIGDQARVVTVASADDRPEDPVPLRLGFLFATLAGKYQVQGYDPLIADINDALTFPVGHDGEIKVRSGGWDKVRSLLRAAGARYFLASEGSRLLPEIERDAAVVRLAADEGLVLLEDRSVPSVVHLAATRQPLPFRWRTNGLELDLPANFPGGKVLFNLAALDGYRWWLDGREMGRPTVFERRFLLELQPGAGRLELRYLQPKVAWGLACSLLALLILLYCLRNEARLLKLLGAEPR